MENVQQAVPLFWVRDIEASLRFYREGLGFAVDRQWVEEDRLRWCWMTRDRVALMLQEFWTTGPHRNVPDGAPAAAGVVIYFLCRDALAAYRELRERGVQAKRPFVGNAMWVTEVVDPDGYRLAFESPTDAAEETEYAEPGAAEA